MVIKRWTYAQRLDGALELVRDIELVCVKEEEDKVRALGEPAADLDKVVRAANALLLTGQNTGRVDKGKLLKERRSAFRALELAQESGTKHFEAAEGLVRLDGQR